MASHSIPVTIKSPNLTTIHHVCHPPWLGQNPLYLPDCDSYLRNSTVLLTNDDEWLTVRSKYGVRAAGLYLLHPNISLAVGAKLGVPSITAVLVEKLDLRNQIIIPWEDRTEDLEPMQESEWNPPGCFEEAELVDRIGSSLRSDEFSRSLHALSLNRTMDSGRKSGRESGTGTGTGTETVSPSDTETEKGSTSGRVVYGDLGLLFQRVTLRFVNTLPVRLVLRDDRRNRTTSSSGQYYSCTSIEH